MTRSTENGPEERVGYWAAFGYQNHVIPVEDPRREGRDLIALCGVMTAPDDVTARDSRPTCGVCATEVRSGRIDVRR